MNKIMTAEQAAAFVRDGDRIVTSGFNMGGYAECISAAIEARFLQTGHPKDVDLLSVTEGGNWGRNGEGNDHFAHEGMLHSVTTGHFSCCPLIADMIAENKILGYNLPQGVIAAMLHAATVGKPGELTKVGLNTYIDPRVEGGRLNTRTVDNIIEVEQFRGEEWLFYPVPKLNIGLIRGTVSDANGNLSLEDEIGPLDIALVARAVKASGGKVIAQVRYLAENGTLPAQKVSIPGILVDAVVVCQEPEREHRQVAGCFFDKAYTGSFISPAEAPERLPLDTKKVLARRAAMELTENAVVNLGVGVPELVSQIVKEEGLSNKVTMTTESGSIGGIPAGGKCFGASVNAQAMVSVMDQFGFYDGGGLDITFLGLAQTDCNGNINVSKFGNTITGCGGFIDIASNTHKVVYMGTFTTSGLKCAVERGAIKILQEGCVKKFVQQVGQITYSGPTGAAAGQDVLYITERAVFRLTQQGLQLIEIAPGIDLERDILAHMDFVPDISDSLKEMPSCIFENDNMDLERFWHVT